MKIILNGIVLIGIGLSQVTLAQQKSSVQQGAKPVYVNKVLIKDRTELFKRTLAYMPSILLSVMGRIRYTEVENYLYSRILSLSAENLNIDDKQEYVKPEKFKLFKVVMSQNPSDFDLSKDEKNRTAFTRPDLKFPIVVNETLINNPNHEISIPDVVQLFVHEIGKKIPNYHQPSLDSLAAKIAAVIRQDYMVIDLSPTEKMHFLNAPFQAELPKLDFQPFSSDDQSMGIFKAHYSRFGREILIYHENLNGFTYVPSLKPMLLDGIKSMKHFGEQQTFLATRTNVEEIRVDRNLGSRPLVRMRINVKERAYRLSKRVEKNEKGEDVPTGDIDLQSLTSSIDEKSLAAPSDELLDTDVEVTIKFKKNGEVEMSRREAIKSTPQIQIKNLKWVEGPDQIVGNLTLEVPKSMSNILNYDLRVFLNARMNEGLGRIEISRMEIKGQIAEIEFRLPSKTKSRQKFFVEELILKNKDVEIMVDLPEAIVVNAVNSRSSLRMLKAQRESNSGWSDLSLIERKEGDKSESLALHELEKHPGIKTVKPGFQKLKFLMRSDVPLHEFYLYIRSSFVTHDPLVVSALKNSTKDFGGMGHDLVKDKKFQEQIMPIIQLLSKFSEVKSPEGFFKALSAQGMLRPNEPIDPKLLAMVTEGFNSFGKGLPERPELKQQSVRFFQHHDEVIHIPASAMRQTQKGPYLWVEIEVPMEILKDKGLYSYDMGVRYIGKMIAVNQSMERWKVSDLADPVFRIEGTHGGLNSCKAYLEGK